MRSYLLPLLLVFIGCQSQPDQNEKTEKSSETEKEVLIIDAGDFIESSQEIRNAGDSALLLEKDQWLSYDIRIPAAGRYRVYLSGMSVDSGQVWMEDYIHNEDGRTYNITGYQHFEEKMNGHQVARVDGVPLDTGRHPIKVHARQGHIRLREIRLEMMQPHRETPKVLKQNMEGSEWEIVWSDEFNGSGLPDSTKWHYNIGDWGWGNNELQYYTARRTENARMKNGALIIEARKNDDGKPWTSARLTTQGRVAFMRGKIEFKAKVPVGRGVWSAGWTLGDTYRDEKSWPYCGEIDILECVGYEINDTTGHGKNHASCHTPKYYFKKGNQITSTIEVDSMNSQWHTYSVEWYSDSIVGYVDGRKYYVYDHSADKMEWPYFQPQNIIINLAVGGGWGGAKGVDPKWKNHQFLLDYVRVYQLK